MEAYWSLFCFPVVFRMLSGNNRVFRSFGLIPVALILVIMIGFRNQVGCDWFHYLDNFQDMNVSSWQDDLAYYEPGHLIINVLCYQLGLSIVATNVIYSLIFVTGLIYYVRRQPLPLLAVLLSVPYLITVVAMGYTRQATAIGCLFFAMVACEKRQVARIMFWVVLGSMFHKSALIFLFLIPVARGIRFDFMSFVTVLSVPVGFYFLRSDVDQYVTNYIDSGMVSDGGFIRLALTATAGVTFLLLRSLFKQYADYRLFVVLAIIALVSLPLNQFASTAVDRMALYLMPFQIAVFARVPLVFREKAMQAAAAVGLTVVFAAQLYVWLNYANNAYCWIPYRNALWST